MNCIHSVIVSAADLVTHYPETHDTLSRNQYKKPVLENLYRFPAGVSCNSVPIFSGTEIWSILLEHCSASWRKPVPVFGIGFITSNTVGNSVWNQASLTVWQVSSTCLTLVDAVTWMFTWMNSIWSTVHTQSVLVSHWTTVSCHIGKWIRGI